MVWWWVRAYAGGWRRLPLTVLRHLAALAAGGVFAALVVRLLGLA